MIAKVDKVKLPADLDGRRTVSDAIKSGIKGLHDKGLTYGAITRKIGVSRTTVIQVCDPEAYEKIKERNRNTVKNIDPEKRKVWLQNNRAKKYRLMKEQK